MHDSDVITFQPWVLFVFRSVVSDPVQRALLSTCLCPCSGMYCSFKVSILHQKIVAQINEIFNCLPYRFKGIIEQKPFNEIGMCIKHNTMQQ